MSRQNISIGSAANDKTGDTLRQAGDKINDTLIELYTFLGGDSNVLPAAFQLDSTGSVQITKGSGTTTLSAVSLTNDRSALLPDLSGTIVLETGAQTLSSKTLTSPVINTPTIGSLINDSNGYPLISISAADSATNYFEIANGDSGEDITLSATGNDDNINLVLQAAGTGSVEMSKGAFTSASMEANGTASALAGYIICNKATGLSITLADGTTTGEYKIFTNKGTGTVTITPTNFAQGTAATINQYDAVTFIWDGSNWYVTGHYGAGIA
jgi:hypothetical protein